ncbi:hypothetical protein HDU96_008053 [Phlyctochytrium bullatum]|nr:hypothetical protein HDU96_008053 [Phlyctochytrium bullatum]
MSTATTRVHQLASHLAPSSNACASSYPQGLLANQVAIITGSGQGIGAAMARLFAKEGASVVVTDLDGGGLLLSLLCRVFDTFAAKAQGVADEIKAAGGKAIAVQGDVTDPAYPEKLVKATVGAFGKINHIVNNAGFTFDAMLHKMTDKAWDIMWSVHCTGPMRILRAAAPHLRVKSDEPKSVVMISSTSGLHGNLGQANYAAAKSAVIGFAKTLAKEWGAFGVRVNTIAYGLIDTRLTRAKEAGEVIEVNGEKVKLGIPAGNATAEQMAAARARAIPLQRGGTPEEAAGAALFLCSPLSSYVSGHCLEVTGGAGI